MKQKKTSIFDKHCNFFGQYFQKKWNPTAKRVEYTNTFSIDNWKSLSENEKSKHTLSNCKACLSSHKALQNSFPAKPVFMQETPVHTVDLQASATNTEKELGRRVLQEINAAWQEKYNHSFTETIPKIEAKLTEKKN